MLYLENTELFRIFIFKPIYFTVSLSIFLKKNVIFQYNKNKKRGTKKMVCSCCNKEIEKGVFKYIYVFCDECSVAMFEKLSLVESTVERTIKEVQEKKKK